MKPFYESGVCWAYLGLADCFMDLGHLEEG
jgi:hypothetical protein